MTSNTKSSNIGLKSFVRPCIWAATENELGSASLFERLVSSDKQKHTNSVYQHM